MFAKLASGEPQGATDAIPESTSAPPPFARTPSKARHQRRQGQPAWAKPVRARCRPPGGLGAGADLSRRPLVWRPWALRGTRWLAVRTGSKAAGPSRRFRSRRTLTLRPSSRRLPVQPRSPRKACPKRTRLHQARCFPFRVGPCVPNAPPSSAPAPAFGAPASQAPDAATESSPTPALQLPTKQASAAVGSGVKQAESPGSDSKDSSDEQRLKWYARQKPPKGAPALLFGPFQPGASGASPAAAVGAQPAPGGAAPRADAAQSLPRRPQPVPSGLHQRPQAGASALGAAPRQRRLERLLRRPLARPHRLRRRRPWRARLIAGARASLWRARVVCAGAGLWRARLIAGAGASLWRARVCAGAGLWRAGVVRAGAGLWRARLFAGTRASLWRARVVCAGAGLWRGAICCRASFAFRRGARCLAVRRGACSGLWGPVGSRRWGASFRCFRVVRRRGGGHGAARPMRRSPAPPPHGLVVVCSQGRRPPRPRSERPLNSVAAPRPLERRPRRPAPRRHRPSELPRPRLRSVRRPASRRARPVVTAPMVRRRRGGDAGLRSAVGPGWGTCLRWCGAESWWVRLR